MFIEKVKKSADDLMPQVEGLVNKVPPLPLNWTTKMANWLYYLVIIGIILDGLAFFMLLGGFGAMMAELVMVGGVFGPLLGILVLTAGLFIVLMLILQLKALPLIRAKQRQGWLYLYYTVLVMIVGMFISFNFVGAVFWGGVCFYILFNIKQHFK